MMANNNFETLNQEIGFEFNKYVLKNPKILEKIPTGAQVVFLLDDDPNFNKWSKSVNKRHREPGQPCVFIHIGRLLPTTSRLEGLEIEVAA